jgi:hypothetical protein
MRQVKYFPAEKRRYVSNNLQCEICGNTECFTFNLKLRHKLKIDSKGNLVVSTDAKTKSMMENALKNNHDLMEKDLIHCTNCTDGYVDFQERLLNWCFERGCPGCSTCASYIDKEELLAICTECIRDRNGEIKEDDCSSICPVYEEGFESVRQHYDITLAEIKEEAGC